MDICARCNGSGEGPVDGTRCLACRGSGEVPSDEEREALEDAIEAEADQRAEDDWLAKRMRRAQ